MDFSGLAHRAWDLFQDHVKHDPTAMSHLAPSAVALLVLCAFLLTVINPFWRVLGLANTVVHEAGHAMAALSTFGRLRGIRINLNHSGDTQFLSSTFLPFRIWASWWGYAFPAVAGWLLVYSAEQGWSGVALTASALVAIIVTLQIRNLTALLAIGAVSAIILCAWWFLPNSVAAVFVFFLGWLLILGGMRAALELFIIHLRGNGEDSDAMSLRSMTLLPAYFWCGSFLGISAYCIYLAAAETIH